MLIPYDKLNHTYSVVSRCIPHPGPNLEQVTAVGTPTYAQIEGDIGIGCGALASGDPDCFLNCYPATSNILAVAPNDCGGVGSRTAVQCVGK